MEIVNKNLNLMIPNNALTIYNVLNNKGFDAYFVGGALRDLYINYYYNTDYKIKDWDIATTARYADMSKMFNKILRVNENGRIISKSSKVEMLIPSMETTAIFINNQMFEVTPIHSYDKDEINFGEDIIGDLSKRDFTINTIAYSPKYGWITNFENKKGEKVNALEDIKSGIIRCVENPDDAVIRNRFIIMRAIIFANRFNFSIEKDTLNALKRNIEDVNLINKGKMFLVFKKILTDRCSDKIVYLKTTGLLSSLHKGWTDDYSDKFIELLVSSNNICGGDFFERIKYIYDRFDDKESLKMLYKSFGVNKECILKLDY